MREYEKNLDFIKECLMKKNISYETYLKEKYVSFKYICIFGAGNIGINTAKRLAEYGIKVDFFCDNDSKKSGQTFAGIPCYLPEKLEDIKEKTMVVIATRFYKEIYNQLQEKGVQYIDRVFTNKFEVAEKIERFGRENIISYIEKVIMILSDEKSKNVYTTIIKNWITLNYSQKELDGMFTDDQYFCKDVISLDEQEYFADGGAYDGDTFEMFYKETKGKFRGAVLFELSKKNYKKLLKNIAGYDRKIYEKISCLNKGLAAHEAVINYCEDDEGSSVVDNGGDETGCLTSIDEVCKEMPVTYIKMDVEGSEKQALLGARTVIKEKKPKLAVCLYHKFEDLWELPLYIHELLPEYRLFIRHHTDLLNETVCYAII